MIQGANSNSIMGMLMGQASTSSAKEVSGLEPQMGRLPDAEQAQPSSSNLFASMLFMLQAGVEDSAPKTSSLPNLGLEVGGNVLPEGGQDLPVLDEEQSTDMLGQSRFLTNSHSTATSGLEKNDVQTQQNPQVLNQALVMIPSVIDEARKMVKQRDASSLLEQDKIINADVELPNATDTDALVDMLAEVEAIEITTPEAINKQVEDSNSTVIHSGNLQEQAVGALSLGESDLVAESQPVQASKSEQADLALQSQSIQASKTEQADLVWQSQPMQASKTESDTLVLQSQSMNMQLNTNNLDSKNRTNPDAMPLNLKPQAGRDLIQDEIELPMDASESEGLDVEEAFLSKPATITHNDKSQQPSLTGINQGQAQAQNIQSLNVQAGQLQSSVAVNADANAPLETMLEEAQEKPAPSVHEQINKTMSKEETLYLGRQSQFWGRQLGSHITTLIKQDVQEAKIHLDPPELGSLEIKLQVQNQETKVQIHASQPQVREALEQQAFRLREALAQEGMNLSGFDVSSGNKEQQGHAQNEQGQGSSFNEGALSELDGNAEKNQTQNKATASSLNLIDTFA